MVENPSKQKPKKTDIKKVENIKEKTKLQSYTESECTFRPQLSNKSLIIAKRKVILT